jgi:Fur family iron response transcriptional regulator
MKTSLTTPLAQDATLQRLRQFGIMPTQQRVDIANLLFAQHQHFSADDILEYLNQHTNSVSKATVYNTLGLFVEKGLVRQVIVDPNKVFYDSNTKPHYHFYNEDSGILTDIDSTQFELLGQPLVPTGTQAVGIDIIIRLRNVS